ncbi:MAG: proline dehydrogenase family protein [Halobacteria archaeon]
MIPPIADKFLAGETDLEAFQHVKDVNSENINVILNHLGEHYHEREPAVRDTITYVEILYCIDQLDVDACISFKPSQIGITVNEELFRDNLDTIFENNFGQFVWMDMEDHTTTQTTIDAYKAHETDNIGMCLQANLKRTQEDLHDLADHPGKIRLVKGAYDEPSSIAYKDKERIDRNYRECMEIMFEEFDQGVAIGSHDLEMIDHAEELSEEYDQDYEIQMLMGVRPEKQRELAHNHELWQYCPYGKKWKSYFYRRVRENTDNLKFAAKAAIEAIQSDLHFKN